MNEASKTKKNHGFLEERVLQGKGIDIGCGNDPIKADVTKFDIKDGDANYITKYVSEQFDFVFSAHCLEHMYNPQKTLREWWKLVRENGYMYIIVPDEDLYEQGTWPSLYNGDHKNTFTIKKKKSWSIKSHNIIDLVSNLPNAKILKIELQDKDYDYKKMYQNIDQTLGDAMAQICIICQKISPVKRKKQYNFLYFLKFLFYTFLAYILLYNKQKFKDKAKKYYYKFLDLYNCKNNVY